MITLTENGLLAKSHNTILEFEGGFAAVRTAGGSTKIIPFAKVVCTWAGPDGKLGTDDDAEFSTTTAADGTYLIKNIPTGKYSCVAEDPKTGDTTSTDSVKVTAASAKKSDAAVKTALLKIAGDELPATGGESGWATYLGLVLLLVGLSLAGLRRRLTDV